MRHVIMTAALLALGTTPQLARAGTGESSFTPDHIHVPVWRVTLAPADVDGDGVPEGSPQSLYECAGPTAADCRVDFADNEAIAALFDAEISIQPGVYAAIEVMTCEPGHSSTNSNDPDYHALIEGAVTLSGTQYFTHPQVDGAGDPLTADLNEAGPVEVGFSGCGSRFPLLRPLLVQEGSTVDLNAFFALRDIAWARLGGASIPAGCVDNRTSGPMHASDGATLSICTAYPILAPYAGDTQPTLETFRISEEPADASTAGAQLLLIVPPEGDPVGGFTRRFFSEGSVQPSAGYDTPLQSIAANGDGTYDIRNYGGWIMGSDGQCVTDDTGHCAMSEYYVRLPAFSRADDSTGTLMTLNNGTAGSVGYRSIRAPE